eukprot:14227385-Alexandrium_andersonii.AAC.1
MCIRDRAPLLVVRRLPSLHHSCPALTKLAVTAPRKWAEQRLCRALGYLSSAMQLAACGLQ